MALTEAEVAVDSITSPLHADALHAMTAADADGRRSQLLKMAIEIWGNEEDAIDWFASPHAMLGGVSPNRLAGTEKGAATVENLLGALDHGFPV